MKTLMIAVAAAAAALVVAQGTQDFAVKEGQKAPAFSMTTTDGKTLNNNNLKGKVVLLDFWATWCGPCKAASPTMQALHEKYAKQGLVVVGANAFERANKDTAAKNYAKEHNYSYTFTVENDELAKSWGVRGIPFFVIIDREGVVRKVQVGFSKGKTDTMFEEAISKLIAEK